MRTATIRRRISRAIDGWGFQWNPITKRQVVAEIWKAIQPLRKKMEETK